MKYTHKFKSQNDDQEFTLSFQTNNDKNSPTFIDPQVYQHRGDLLCNLSTFSFSSPTHFSLHTVAIYSHHKFGIEIYINAKGCEIIIVETVLTTIYHEFNLQPCNDLNPQHSY